MRDGAKKLACGHVLHVECLKRWLEQQQTCPTCRRPVEPIKLIEPKVQLPSRAQRQLLHTIKLPPGWGLLLGQREIIIRGHRETTQYIPYASSAAIKPPRSARKEVYSSIQHLTTHSAPNASPPFTVKERR